MTTHEATTPASPGRERRSTPVAVSIGTGQLRVWAEPFGALSAAASLARPTVIRRGRVTAPRTAALLGAGTAATAATRHPAAG